MIVACANPKNSQSNYEYNNYDSSLSRAAASIDAESKAKRDIQLLNNNGWRCICGTVNAYYNDNCTTCGKTRNQVKEMEKNILAANSNNELNSDNLKMENLKKLKELLDIGAITQEEFDTKKKEMLGL